MSKEEAMKLALDALESCSGVPHWPALQPVITALREELAEQPAPVQEPVAITERMAFAFHNAITDGALGTDDMMDIMRGLEAAFSHITTPKPAPVPWSQALEAVWAEPDNTTPQPAQQEPMARIDSEPSWDGALGLYRAEVTLTKKLGQFTDLYTTPQAQQEPVGEVNRYGLDSHGRKWHGIHWYDPNVDVPHGTKLYTTPQAQRKPLTDAEMDNCLRRAGVIATLEALRCVGREVEAAHGIKENT